MCIYTNSVADFISVLTLRFVWFESCNLGFEHWETLIPHFVTWYRYKYILNNITTTLR